MEETIGKVIHYYDRAEVAIIKVAQGGFKVGDTLHFKGAHTDYEEAISSMQLDHKPHDAARAGEEVAVKVGQKVREGDAVYKKA
ncbi:MAG: hypothetical protein Q7R73_01635 [bacterium]|nr:hypothetical protein [bacterium]